ncbi:MATE family efflux transporter, partial [Oscillospiraceae bacterium OttesenSCG-928-F05]|nr:MATE family efflux transporter [Oscillospiraceae bacterium OttesenSCG-928-F05]
MTERRKKILDYLLPSVGAMFVSYFYIVVDGMFIGQGVGPSALASVNLAVPFVDLLTAVAAMITMGGATITAIRMGRGDTDGANVSFRMSASLVVLISAAVTAVGVIFPHALAQLFGATDTLIVETVNYIRWCSAFSIFFTLAIFMAAYVRNDGSPRLAFWGMV